jgi:hypothetical protein
MRSTLLSQLAGKQLSKAHKMLVDKEYEISLPILSESLQRIEQGTSLEALTLVSETIFALARLIEGCGYTLTPQQCSELGCKNGNTTVSSSGLLSRVIAMFEASAPTSPKLLSAKKIQANDFDAKKPAPVQQLYLLNNNRRKVMQQVLGRQTQVPPYDAPQKLNTVGGMFPKAACVSLINSLLEAVMNQYNHALPFALHVIASEIAEFCSSENFDFKIKANPNLIVEIIHGTISITNKNLFFITFVRSELQKKCPFTIPNFSQWNSGDLSALPNEQKGVLTVYALCCVTDGGLTGPDDAWQWLANAINWCRDQRSATSAAGGSAKLELFVADAIDRFLRITSSRLSQLYGQHFTTAIIRVMQAIVPPMLKREKGQEHRLEEFLEHAMKTGQYLAAFNS